MGSSKDVIVNDSNIESMYEGYLDTYYSDDIVEDETIVLRHAIEFVSTLETRFSKPVSILEVGNGGTLHHLIPFCSVADNFVVSDYRESACKIVSNLTENAEIPKIWYAYTQFILRLEIGKEPNHTEITRRYLEVKNKIKKITKADLRIDLPLGHPAQFPIVLCYYTTEVAAQNSKNDWKKVFRNLASLVETGGYLVLSCVGESNFFLVNIGNISLRHLIPNLTLQDLIEALEQNSFRIEPNAAIEGIIKGQKEHGLNKVILVSAQKN